MQFLELGDGTHINVSAIEALGIVLIDGAWDTYVATAGNRYRDRVDKTEAAARRNLSRLLIAITDEHICANCATPVTRRGNGQWAHTLSIYETNGCVDAKPADLTGPEWNTVDELLGDGS